MHHPENAVFLWPSWQRSARDSSQDSAAGQGKVAFADKLAPADRTRALKLLGLPASTGPARWWLTEFEDPWPYRLAPADVYFSPAPDQGVVKRPPIVEYVSGPSSPDVAFEGVILVALVAPVIRQMRRRRRGA